MGEYTPNKKSKIGLVILLIIIVAAVAIIVLNPFAEIKALLDSATEEQTSEDKLVALAVAASPVGRETLQNYIRGNGNVIDPKAMDIYPEVMGKLSSVFVKVGDRVEEGALLATIDPSKAGVVYKESTIVAPASGTVLAVNFAQGSTVSAQAPLLRIGMLEALEVEMDIAERYIGSVPMGTQAVATFVSYPGRQFLGEVTRLSPVLNPTSRTLEIGISLEDPDALVKSGMFPMVTILTEAHEEVLVVLRTSLLYDDNQAFVFVVDKNNVVTKRPITIGLVVDDKVEVVSGLEEGELVVTQGQTLLTSGTSVRIVE